MKDIKFRGQGRYNNKFYYGDLVKNFEENGELCFYIYVLGKSKGEQQKHEVKPETVGQYTGLKDKNGKEIYKGDIVRWGMGGLENWNRYAVVELEPCLQFRILFYIEEKTNIKHPTDNYVFSYSNFMYKDTEKYLEIIGNICENLELLEVQNEN